MGVGSSSRKDYGFCCLNFKNIFLLGQSRKGDSLIEKRCAKKEPRRNFRSSAVYLSRGTTARSGSVRPVDSGHHQASVVAPIAYSGRTHGIQFYIIELTRGKTFKREARRCALLRLHVRSRS